VPHGAPAGAGAIRVGVVRPGVMLAGTVDAHAGVRSGPVGVGALYP
jgi:hypothetical protein